MSERSYDEIRAELERVVRRMEGLRDEAFGASRPRLTVIAGTAKRRTKRRGKLHLVAS